MCPRGDEYQRFIHLVDVFREAGWYPARMLAASPFRMADVGTLNAILLRAEGDLLALAKRFGTPAERAEIEARMTRLHAALDRLWRDDLGLYASMDLMTHTTIPIGTSAEFPSAVRRACDAPRGHAGGDADALGRAGAPAGALHRSILRRV